MGDAANIAGPRCIFTTLPTLPPDCISHTVPVEKLLAMSRRENDLRLNDPTYQALFKQYHLTLMNKPVPEDIAAAAARISNLGPSQDIIEHLQRRVLDEFGYSADDELVMYELRTAAMQYPDRLEFQEAAIYQFNRAGDVASVTEGSVGPDCALFEPDSLREVSLHQWLRGAQQVHEPSPFRHHPRVVITGSYT